MTVKMNRTDDPESMINSLLLSCTYIHLRNNSATKGFAHRE